MSEGWRHRWPFSYLRWRWGTISRAILYRFVRFQFGDRHHREVQGSVMDLDLSDPGISTDLAAYGIREPGPTLAYQRELRERDVGLVVDIGANIGYYALQAFAHGDADHVIAIEPEPSNVKNLRRNLALNDLKDKVTVLEAAIGARNGRARLARHRQSNCHRLAEDGDLAVEQLTLAAAVERAGYDLADVDIVRMDVEGGETDVLRGIDDLPACLWNIEFHGGSLDAGARRYIEQRFDGATILAGFGGGREVSVGSFPEAWREPWANLLIETTT